MYSTEEPLFQRFVFDRCGRIRCPLVRECEPGYRDIDRGRGVLINASSGVRGDLVLRFVVHELASWARDPCAHMRQAAPRERKRNSAADTYVATDGAACVHVRVRVCFFTSSGRGGGREFVRVVFAADTSSLLMHFVV